MQDGVLKHDTENQNVNINIDEEKPEGGRLPFHVSAGLRVATLNIGQGMRTKLPLMLQWAHQLGIHVLALQETGACLHDHSLLRHFGYHMILVPHRSAVLHYCCAMTLTFVALRNSGLVRMADWLVLCCSHRPVGILCSSLLTCPRVWTVLPMVISLLGNAARCTTKS